MTLSNAITGDGGGNGGTITKSGAATLTFAAGNTFDQALSVTGGTLAVSADSCMGVASVDPTLNGGTLQTTATFSSARDFTMGASGGTFSTDNATELTLNGQITGAALEKDGDGTLYLTDATNTFSTLAISGGTLSTNSSGALGSDLNVLVHQGTLETTADVTLARGFAFSGSGGTFTPDADTTLVLNGQLTGTACTISGSGTVQVTDVTNTFTDLLISGGTLSTASDAALGADTTMLIGGGGTLVTTATMDMDKNISLDTGGGIVSPATGTTLTLSGTISNTALTMAGAGTVILGDETNSFSSLTINNGTLSAATDGALGADTTPTINGAILSLTDTFSTAKQFQIGASNATIDVADTHTVTNSGATAGTGRLTKSDEGTLVVTAGYTHTGGTTVSNGTLQLSGGSGALSTTGTLTIDEGALFEIATGAGSKTVGAVSSGTHGEIDVNNNTLDIQSGTLNGPVNGTGTLTKSTAGTLLLNNDTSSIGAVTINGGTLTAGNGDALGAGTVTINAATLNASGAISLANDIAVGNAASIINTDNGSITLSGILSGTDANTLSKNGDNSLIVTGTSHDFDSTVSVNQGILSVSNDVALGTGDVSLNGGDFTSSGAVSLVNAFSIDADSDINAASNITLESALTGASGNTLTKTGAAILTLSADSSAGLESPITISAGDLRGGDDDAFGSGQITIGDATLSASTGISIPNAVEITDANSIVNTATGAITINGSLLGTAGALNKAGTGTLSLPNANGDFGASVTVDGGTLSVGNDASLGHADITLNAGTTLAASADVTLNEGNFITLGGSSTIGTGANTFTVTGSISGGAGSALTKSGSGTLVLSESNSFEGGLLLTAGTVAIENTSSLGTNQLQMSNGTTLRSDVTGTVANAIAITTSATVDATLATVLTGAISGDTLVINGAGGVGVSNPTNSMNDITVSSSSIGPFNNASLGSGTITLTNGAFAPVLSFTTTNDFALSGAANTFNTQLANTTISGEITGATPVTVSGGNSLSLTGANSSLTSSFNVTAGTLSAGDDDAFGSGQVTIGNAILTSSATVTLPNDIAINNASSRITAGANPITLSGILSGTDSNTLEKLGAETLSLTGTSHDFDSNVTVTAGTLSVGNDVALGTAAVSLNGGTFTSSAAVDLANAFTVSSSSTISTASNITLESALTGGSGATLTKSGANSLILSADSSGTLDSPISVTAGTLSAGDDDAFGTGQVTIGNAILTSSATVTLPNDIAINNASSRITAGANPITLSGILSGTDTNTLEKLGGETLSLTGTSHDFDSNVTVTAGTLSVGNDVALGTAAVSLNGGTFTSSAAVDLANAFTISSSSAISTASDITLESALTGGSGVTLTKSGANSLILSADSSGTLDSPISVTAGTLSAGDDDAFGTGQVTLGNATLTLTQTVTLPNALVVNNASSAIDTAGFNMTLSGEMSGTDSFALNKTGSGILAITGSNHEFDSPFTLSTGALSISNDVALGTAPVSLANGTQFTSSADVSLANAFTVSGSTSIVATNNITLESAVTGNNLSSITKSNNGFLAFSADNSATMDSQLTASGGILRAGADNAFGTGQVIVSGATIDSSATVTLPNRFVVGLGSMTVDTDGSDITLSGELSGNSAFNLTKTGADTLFLTGDSHDFESTVIISAGAVSVGNDAAMGTSAVTLNSGELTSSADVSLVNAISLNASSTINAANEMTLESALTGGSGVTLTKSGANSLILTADSSGSLDSPISLTAGTLSAGDNDAFGTGQVTLGNATLTSTQTVTLPNALVINNASSAIDTAGFNMTLSGEMSGTDSFALNKTGSGILAITGSNHEFDSPFTLSTGALSISNDVALGTAPVSLANGTQFTSTSDVSLANAFTVSGTATVVATNNITLESAVTGNSSSAISKSNSGVLELAVDNSATFDGAIITSGGILRAGADDAFGTGQVTISSTTLDSSATVTLPNRFVVGLGSMTVDTDGFDMTLSGELSGGSSLNLTKTGADTLFLTGDSHDFESTVIISDGAISVSSGGAMGSSAVTLNSGELTSSADVSLVNAISLNASSTINAANEMTLESALTGGGGVTLTKSGANSLILTADSSGSLDSPISLTAGTLTAGDDDALGTGQVTIGNAILDANTTVNLPNAVVINDSNSRISAASNPITLSGTLTGSSGNTLTKSGADSLIITADNSGTLDSAISVTAGTLSAGDNDAFGTGQVTIGNATVTSTGVATLPNAFVVGNASSVINTGSGSITLSGELTGLDSNALQKAGTNTLSVTSMNHDLASDITVTGGVLSAGNDIAFGTGALTLNGGDLTASTAVALANAVTLSADADINAANNITLEAALTGGGGVTLTKTGSGALILSADSGGTLSSPISVNAGTLTAGDDDAFGVGQVTLNSATINSSGVVNLANALNVNNAASTVSTSGGNMTLSGQVTGTGTLNKAGTGTLVLGDATNSFTAVDIDAGTLSVVDNDRLGAATVNINDGTLLATGNITSSRTFTLGELTSVIDTGAFDVSIDTNITGAGRLNKDGSGTLTLTGSNSMNSVTLNGGVLRVDADAALGNGVLTINAATLTPSTSITVSNPISVENAAATFDTTNGNSTISGSVTGAGTLNKAGANTLTLTNNSNVYTALEIDEGTVSVADDDILGATTITINDGTLLATGDFSSSRNFVLTNSGSTLDTGANNIEIGVITGNGALNKAGSGQLTLTNNNTFSGGLNLNAGTLAISSDANMGAAGVNPVLNGGTLLINSTFSSDRDFALDVSSTIDFESGIRELTVNGVISGTGLLTKAGDGELLLGDANTYTGGTTISAGTLTLNSGGSLSTTGTVTADGTLQIASSAGAKTIGTIAGSGSINVNNNTMTINSGSFSGVISGSGGSLTKAGAGSLTLSGNNTFDTGLTVSGGTLVVSSDNNLGAADVDPVIDQGTLNTTADITTSRAFSVGSTNGEFNTDDTTTLTVNGVISGAGSLTKSGDGEMVVSQANTYSGGTTVEEGTLTMSGSGTISTSGTTTVDAGAVLAIASGAGARSIDVASGSGNLELNDNVLSVNSGSIGGVVSGTGGLTKASAGTLTLSNTNTFSGSLTINAGTLSVGADANLGDSGIDPTINGGTLAASSNLTTARGFTIGASNGAFSSNNAIAISGVITGSGAVTKSGSGTLTLSGVNDYTGGTTLSAGGITLSGSGALSTSGTTTLGSGTTFTIASGAGAKSLGTVNGAGNIALNNNTLTVNNGTLTGVISGSGGLTKANSGTLIVSGNDTYTGDTTVTGGTFQASKDQSFGGSGSVITNGGEIDFTETFSTSRTFSVLASGGTYDIAANKELTFAGGMSGSGTLTKTGSGNMTVTGNGSGFTGTTNFNSGTLTVSGSMGGPVVMASGTTLKGTGSVGGCTNSGNLEPGASIGTLTINGDFTQTSAGTLNVEISPSAADKLVVTGTANLGGTVFVIPETGVYAQGTEYTIITAGSINGTFAALSDAHELEFALAYSGNSVILSIPTAFSLLPVSPQSLSGTAKAIADYLFCNPPKTTRSADLVWVEDLLATLSTTEYPIALTRLAPLQYGALPLSTARLSSQVWSNFTPWDTGCNPEDRHFYITPFYQNDHQRARDLQFGFTSFNYGLVLGGEKVFTNDAMVGLGGGYVRTRLNWQNDAGFSDANTFYVGVYTGYTTDAVGLLVGPMVLNSKYEVHRKIIFDGLNRTAKSDVTSWGAGVHLDGYYQWTNSYGISLTPRATVDFISMQMDHFHESGAQSINVDMNTKMYSYCRPTAQATFSRALKAKGLVITPRVTAGYTGTFILSKKKMTARFYEQLGTCQNEFSVNTFDHSINQFLGKVGFTVAKCKRFNADFNYEIATGGKNITQTGRARLEWSF
ncbi:MAG: autotransporter-associated beta strand repeat-containing protein [Simkaniaceae bacterium]|nr:autotransporter-associated beta strand repeat-containing protein [Simkaniaceae bacterium]